MDKISHREKYTQIFSLTKIDCGAKNLSASRHHQRLSSSPKEAHARAGSSAAHLGLILKARPKIRSVHGHCSMLRWNCGRTNRATHRQIRQSGDVCKYAGSLAQAASRGTQNTITSNAWSYRVCNQRYVKRCYFPLASLLSVDYRWRRQTTKSIGISIPIQSR